MNRKMRRAEKQMMQADAIELLRNGEYGVLACVDSSGQPYGVPVNYEFDGEDQIYFHGAPEGHTLDNLKDNPRVCFTVVGFHQVMDWKLATAYESVIVFGEASEVLGDEKFEALRQLALKFSPNYMNLFEENIEQALDRVHVTKIQVHQITGKEHKLEES